MPSCTGCSAWSRRTVPDEISRRAATRARTCRQSSARLSPSSLTVRQRSAGQGASRRRYRYAARRRAGHGQEPALFVTCHRPAPKDRGALSQTGTTVSRPVSQASASLTYRIGLTCIGDLAVKVATLGRAGLDDPYATTRTPWSADVRICRIEGVARSYTYALTCIRDLRWWRSLIQPCRSYRVSRSPIYGLAVDASSPPVRSQRSYAADISSAARVAQFSSSGVAGRTVTADRSW
jgi:hypothetical protein